MKIDKYNKLKLKLEVHKLEQNYFTLDRILYYFSFLGNIFLIYFGYFFVKSITDSIPPLFPYQDTFFTIFVALFLTGYELTKRFVLEQLSISILQIKKFTTSMAIGSLICLGLIAGSFYLSIKGAHRLIDNTETIQTVVEANTSQKTDSIAKYYDKEISYYRSQPARSRAERQYRDSIVASLQQTKDSKLAEVENKTQERAAGKLDVSNENSTAFFFITVFLELLILIGVGFNAFYTIGSYDETKKLLQTPKFKQLELNLKLLRLYYQNGKKLAGDPTLSYNKFQSLVQTQGIYCSQKDLKAFTTLCQELEIIRDSRGKRKELTISYDQAKKLIENQEGL
jgi:hypothetical protein